MFKLIKYELMGRLKLILGGLAVLVLLNIFFIIGFNFWWQGGMEAAFGVSVALGLLGTMIIAIDSIIIIRRDLYNDTGYLLFTIPQNGYSILGSKLIVGILEVLIFIVYQVLVSAIFIVPKIQGEFWAILSQLMQLVPNVFLISIVIFWSMVSLLLIITFSIVLAKSILNTKRFSNLASFGTFILTSVAIGYIGRQLEKIPWTTRFDFFDVYIGNVYLQAGKAVLNVPETLFQAALPVALFIISGYLIQNKLEMR